MTTPEEQIATLTGAVQQLERRCKVLSWLLGVTVLGLIVVGFLWDRFGQYLGRKLSAAEVRGQRVIAADLETQPDAAEQLFKVSTQQHKLGQQATAGWGNFAYNSATIAMEPNCYEYREFPYRGLFRFEIWAKTHVGNRPVAVAEVGYRYSRKQRRWINDGWSANGAEAHGFSKEVNDAMRAGFGDPNARAEKAIADQPER